MKRFYKKAVCPSCEKEFTALADSIRASLRKRKRHLKCEECRKQERELSIRFFKKVNKKGSDICWEWRGSLNNYGYGIISKGSTNSHNRKQMMAHRVSYEIHIGAIPDGLIICHKCNNPKCVNPKHLYAGTPWNNYQDMVACGSAERSYAAILPYRAKNGQRPPNIKYSLDVIKEVKRLLSLGIKNVEISKKTGVNRAVVSDIKCQRAYTYI